MPVTQSPIDARSWAAFVGLQQWMVDHLLMTPVFKAAVVTWLGLLLIRAIYYMVASGSPGMALGRFALALGYCALGLTLIRSKEDFRPVNARGAPWADSAKVRASGKHESLQASTQGLAFYIKIHRGASEIGAYISSQVGQLFKDQQHSQSPYLLMQTMAQTAGATIDDPKAVSSLNWLFENCADRRDAPVLSATSSYSALFDLGRPECRDRYTTLRQDLKAWASDKWGSSLWNIGEIKLAQLRAKFGGIDEETLQNKMIASALVNMARSHMGRNLDNVNTGALLAGKNADPLLGSSATFFVGLNNALSTAGLANGALGRLTGVDFIGADARNQSAVLYNKIVQYIPPIRGYAKGILALAFVFAAAGLCFGTPRFMIAWFGTLVLFTAYEPLSTIVYEITMLLTNAQETTDALGALKSDPLVLSGAAIIDDNLAKIEAAYFVLQLGVATICGAGGISLFVFSKRIGGGLADGIVSKMSSLTNTINIARAGRSAGR